MDVTGLFHELLQPFLCDKITVSSRQHVFFFFAFFEHLCCRAAPGHNVDLAETKIDDFCSQGPLPISQNTSFLADFCKSYFILEFETTLMVGDSMQDTNFPGQ